MIIGTIIITVMVIVHIKVTITEILMAICLGTTDIKKADLVVENHYKVLVEANLLLAEEQSKGLKRNIVIKI